MGEPVPAKRGPKMGEEKRKREKRLPFINFRLLVFCAFGLIFGIFLYMRIRFGGLKPSDFLFCGIFLGFSLFPFSWKRTLALLLAVALFGGIGAGAIHIYTQNFLRGPEEGTYFITGTVASFTVGNGRCDVLLEDLAFDGAPAGGKLRLTVLSEDVRAGDILAFETSVKRNGLPMSGNQYAEYCYYSDIRYEGSGVEYNKTGTGKNFLLRIVSALYDRLDGGMGGAEAEVAFALLTGNSRGMDEGISEEVRTGGIAHIFAVSGLHIGILFGAVMLVFRRKRYAVFPAIGAVFLYSALCSFTVSSVRAVVMCSVMGLYRAFGRKYDFPQSIALAAIVVLLIDPADFLSAGFRLSFGACLGLALFSGTLSRLFKKIPHVPKFLASYLAANLSVQLFTFPILLEAFGYFSVWGFALNLVLIPLLPAFFLTVLLFSVFALIIPPAAGVFLAVPKGLLSLFLLVISAGDFSYALAGFSLGAGGVVWLVGSLVLSEKFRLRPLPRIGCAAGLAAVFALCLVLANVVFTGVRIDVYACDSGSAAIVRTPDTAVLLIDGGIGLDDAEDFLNRTYGGELDGVFVLSENELAGVNRAAFLDAEAVYACDEIATGLQRTNVVFGKTAEIGGMRFEYETRGKLALISCGVVVEFDFEGNAALGADLFIGAESGGLKYFLDRGIIKVI